jgi:hypothetical protein
VPSYLLVAAVGQFLPKNSLTISIACLLLLPLALLIHLCVLDEYLKIEEV